MKKFFPIALIGLFLLSFGQFAQAQAEKSEGPKFAEVDKSVLDIAYYPPRAAFRNFAKTAEEKKAGQPVVRVIYSRPLKNGRDVFGELLEFGEVWRVGANESTEVLFLQDVSIGGQRVKAGRYTLYATLGEKEWKVSFNTDLDGWGAYAYNADHDVASISVPVGKSSKTIEAFSIAFEKADDGAHMIMGWDDAVVRVPINF